MKRCLAWLLAVVAVVSLAACGNPKSDLGANDSMSSREPAPIVGTEESETVSQPTAEVPEPSAEQPATNNAGDEIRKDFKAAMDAYETFMNEYVDFMKKYKKNPSDISLLADYTNYMSRYAEFVKDFEKWETEDMNAAEAAYYLEVQARVSQKLLDVAQ